MSMIKDREKAFENKFAHDEAMLFKAAARRNKLLGIWASEKLGKCEDGTKKYTMEVIESDFEEAGDDDVLRKVYADFKDAGIEVNKEEIRRQMDYLLGIAKQEVMEEV